MKMITYFKAYKQAESWKTFYERRRGGNMGIAVKTDDSALKWQRYDRQSKKFANRMVSKMKANND